MCGIVGAVAQRDVAPILIEGLRRLEYRGYDSAGAAIIDAAGRLGRVRSVGKVANLAPLVDAQTLPGQLGIAHTRWATHGGPSEANAHPHVCQEMVAVVHNGIIENHLELRARLEARGYEFTSQTDTEVVAHQIHQHMMEGHDVLAAVRATVAELVGAFALGVMSNTEPNRLIAARRGSPLIVGVGIGEHFIASDVAALLPVTQRFVFLQEGDIADVSRTDLMIFDNNGVAVQRPVTRSELSIDSVERGLYRHYMEKEIHEQPTAIAETLGGRLGDGKVLEESFGPHAPEVFDRIKAVRIIACGTSYHAGLVARNWFEGLAGVPCQVEVASEFRYRHPVADPDTLIVTISQSGETADTLAALRASREQGFGPSLSIVNVPESSLVRESDLVMMTRAGPEIGVASTKAFTTQLVALLMLVVVIGRRHKLGAEREASIVEQLRALPRNCERVLAMDGRIRELAEHFVEKQHALFLGRGVQYAIALEGALKLKEISYIHAEAYPAGELKHGPLALVDEDMPVIAIAPNDALLEKLRSNLEEVRARGGELYVFSDREGAMQASERVHVTEVPDGGENVVPVLYTIPLQLLAYHVAVLKGTDVDQPRNLAKSVTVE